MFRSVFQNCRKVYSSTLPTMVTFSGTVGLLTGIYTYGDMIMNETKYTKYTKYTSMNLYTHLIGYISIGILTGVVYPISFPLCVYYVVK